MARLPSGLPDLVGDSEDLVRFLTSSSLFNSVMVKPAAFLPNSKDDQTSVFRHGPEPRDALWPLAFEHVVVGRPLHGAAIVRAGHVRAASLEIEASEPPPRHANIVGWASSDADLEMQKAQRKEQAALIAQRAVLLRY